MTDLSIRESLRKSLEDLRLSRGEKRALNQILDDESQDVYFTHKIRSEAFDLVREGINGENPQLLIDWLEEIVKLLLKEKFEANQHSVSKAFFSPGDDCLRFILDSISSAKRNVSICVFTITDNRISSTIERAHRRGVDFRIITDDDKTMDAGSDIMRLDELGIPIRTDKTKFHMHHKFAIFDDSLLVSGSYNWTRSAADYNEENIIATDHPELVGQFEELFNHLWNKFSG